MKNMKQTQLSEKHKSEKNMTEEAIKRQNFTKDEIWRSKQKLEDHLNGLSSVIE